MSRVRAVLIWTGLGLVAGVPLVLAAQSPLLAWRSAVYIAAGLAGVAALALVLLQPLLAGVLLPGVAQAPGRRVHRWIGAAFVALLIVHVGGLWVTSPPDVIDALLFVSPTPFSAWGVVAMWAAFLSGAGALLRMPPWVWRACHTALALTIVIGSVVHVLLIEGTMEPLSKALLSVLILAATGWVVIERRAWAPLWRRWSGRPRG